MQWKSASKAIKCHCDLAWDTSPSLKNAQWTIKKEDTFQCFSVSLPVVVGLTFFSVVFKTSCCLLCTEEYYSCFYKLYVIKFHSGFGGLSHHCLREILCEDKKKQSFLLCVIWRGICLGFIPGSQQGISQTLRVLEISLLYSWFGSL